MDFDSLKLEVGNHAAKRWMERSGIHFDTVEEARVDLEYKLKEYATIFIENEFYRYYRYEEFIIPAAFIRNEDTTILKAVTVLEESMLKGRFDTVLETYITGAVN